MQRLVFLLIFATLAFLHTTTFAQDKKEKTEKADQSDETSIEIPNPILFLIRDPGVQADLQLRDDQKAAVRELLDTIDGPLWLLRDIGAQDGKGRAEALIAKAKSGLHGILNATQLRRLDQIVLHAQGPEALLLPGVAQKLALSNDQRQQVRDTIKARHQEFQELKKQAAENKDPEKAKELAEKAAKVRQTEHEQLLIILHESQKKQWAAMLGKSIDLTNVQLSRIKAPEIAATGEWINSEPLTLAKLRGRVVALNFWTFG